MPRQGKGNDNPASRFENHQLVLIGNQWYDPSYGRNFDSLDDWENQSVEAYYKEAFRFLNEVAYNVDFNGDGNVKNVDVGVYIEVIKENPAGNQVVSY